MDKNILTTTGNSRGNFFRPMFVKRSLSDLSSLPKKRNGGRDSVDIRTNRSGNVVPVVSVHYDVPRTPPSPLMYRIKRLSTPQTGYNRSKSEEKMRIRSKFHVHHHTDDEHFSFWKPFFEHAFRNRFITVNLTSYWVTHCCKQNHLVTLMSRHFCLMFNQEGITSISTLYTLFVWQYALALSDLTK